ncbi:MAG: right-handed parallel beta-helix repeat-containing protein [Pseudomonadales bacterium]|nr:right-handed parallel beta-helix repeat-containing protein [Pseudomonadales bacterium]
MIFDLVFKYNFKWLKQLLSVIIFVALTACGGEGTPDLAFSDDENQSDTSGEDNSGGDTSEPDTSEPDTSGTEPTTDSSSDNMAPVLENQNLSVSEDAVLTITLGALIDEDGDTIVYSVSESVHTQPSSEENQIIFQSSTVGNELLIVTADDGVNDPVEAAISIVVAPADGNIYYLSTMGDDDNDGEANGLSWASFEHAWTVMQPGDTLIVADGIYAETLSPTVSGAEGYPITIIAENRGEAIIEKSEDGSAISILSSVSKTLSYITIDGFIARSKGENSAIVVGSTDNIAEEFMSNHITIRNTGAFGSADQTNTVVVAIARTRDSLFEDMWAYGYGRKAVQLYGSTRITVRRMIARYDYWDGAGYKPNDPRIGFAIYNTEDGIYENILVLDNAPDPVGRSSASKAGFAIEGNLSSTATILGSKGNSWYGSIALGNAGSGLYSSGVSTGTNDDNRIENFVSWDNENGMIIHANMDNNEIVSATLGSNRIMGLRINNDNVYNTLFEKMFVTDNDSFPFFIAGQGGYYGVDTIFQNNTATENGMGSDIEPSLAPGLEYLVKPSMIEGSERGAVILNRYQGGVLTDEALWPWPNEDLIQQHMCNEDDLINAHRVAANGDGWEPQWCASEKTLTEYIWEFLGNTIPADIYP